MTYNRIDPFFKRHRKKKAHYSSVFIIGLAFLAFIVIGLTVSISIRACTYSNEYVQERPHYHKRSSNSSNFALKESRDISSDYAVSDSILRICTPKPLDGISEQILRKTSYIVSYNKDTKCPNWVAWQLTAEHTDGSYKRLQNFHEENDVPEPRATLQDYKGSGWSRGHMCPAGDNKWDEQAMYDSFSLVNICPQNSSHNSGLWNSLEMDCRRWAQQYGEIYIVCGPVFMNREHETIGTNGVYVPEAFFKVVLCLKGKPKAFGIITRNTASNKKQDLYYNSVDQVEQIIGIDFFPALPDDIESIVEAKADICDWN